MPFQKSLSEYAEPLALTLFLVLLGYLFFAATAEETPQTATASSSEKAEVASSARPPATDSAQDPGPARSAGAAAGETPPPPPPARDEFGFPKDTFEVEEGRVERGETFANLLTGEGVPYAQAVELAEKARPVFNVRRLQADRPYRFYRQGGEVKHFVYQRGPVEYVAFSLGDSLSVREGERSVTTVERSAEGPIEGSLYESFADAGADPTLAYALSETYAWQIDFYRLRRGDRFKVIYEEKRVGGEPIGIGRVLGARIDHRGDSYYGLYLEEEGEYFDEEGDNLRKALLKAPLKFARVSSRYQKRRFHPVQKRWKSHKGTDYAAAPGTPVYSVGDGRVVEARYDRYNGNYVKVRHNDTYTTQYLHFSKIADGIEPGVRVEQKQVIGYVGSTGLSTGPHVHYSFWKNGRQVDHYKEELPSAPPVADSLVPAYDRLKAHLLPRLRPSDSAGPEAAVEQHALSEQRGDGQGVATGPSAPAPM